jgi:D-alanine-D-alanine ligase
MHNSRKRIAVLFGGRSVEHEISVITALQLILAIDPEKFDVVPVYIAPNGAWYTGDELLERSFYRSVPAALSQLQEVTLLPKPGVGGLVRTGSPGNVVRDLISRRDDIIPVDLFLPVFHGQYGEDGGIQGLFELANVPYTGSDFTSSAVAMNKYICKRYLEAHGIPVLPALTVRRSEARSGLTATVEWVTSHDRFCSFPLFVKPCNLGSSIGVSRVKNVSELPGALTKVFKYDTLALIEPCVTEIMEINVSVRDAGRIEASVVEIPVSESGVLSYEEKYLRPGGKKSGPSQGMASLSRIIDPPDLDSDIKERVIALGIRAFELLGCSGVARLDFIFDLAKSELYFNELNAFPGSCAFYLWARSSPRVLYTELINQMITTALDHYAVKSSLDRDIGLKALR